MQQEETAEKIENARVLIRDVDRQIVYMIGKRLELVREIAGLKTKENLPTRDPKAEQLVVDNILGASKEVELKQSYGKTLAELLINISVSLQETQASVPAATSKDQMLKRVFEKVQALKRNGVECVRFEIGEPNFEPPAAVIDGAVTSLQTKRLFGYGPAAGLQSLREAIARELSNRYGASIDSEQILVVPGARFAIFATVLALTGPLDRIVIPQPAWPAYEECGSYSRARVVPINTTLEGDWDLDLGQLRTEMEGGAKMLILNSPSNPTGKAIPREQFTQIVNLAQEHNCMILSDEVYDRYVKQPVASILEYPEADYVYANSFSKQFGLTGWRVAYLVTKKERIPDLRRVIQTAVTCVPEFVQEAALRALKEVRAEADKEIADIMSKVELTCAELKKTKLSFREPDGGFYVFPKVNRPSFDSVKFAEYLVDKHRISLSPGSSFGDYSEFFRLAISVPRDEITDAVRSIGVALEEYPD